MPDDLLRARPVLGESDLAAMYDLAMACSETALHLADLPWRFNSPALKVAENTRLWEDANGNLVAWAFLSTWNCIDEFVRPGGYADHCSLATLRWAVRRQREQNAEKGGQVALYASSRSDDDARVARLEQHGFVRDAWYNVHLGRELNTPISEPALPPGFTIRPLDGEREVERYVSMHRIAFGTERMTTAWRRATLGDPHYVPDLDLVAVAPDGTLAAFCVCWVTSPLSPLGGARIAQVEPMGVLPEFRRLGLGRALLQEELSRAKALGAVRMEVDSFSFSEPALRAYEQVGFRRLYDELIFVRPNA
jgi:GNAT superfamily N-acetyltransferase